MRKTRNVIFCGLFAALIAVGAWIQIPTPLVPITLQTFFVLLAGMVLGPRGGAAAAMLYVLMGLVGLPVFSGGGGIGYVVRPTFGYLMGFGAGAWLTGTLAAIPRNPGVLWRFLSAAAGLLVIYLTGAVYYDIILRYYLQTPMDIKALLLACVVIPLPGDLICAFLGAMLGKRLEKTIKTTKK